MNRADLAALPATRLKIRRGGAREEDGLMPDQVDGGDKEAVRQILESGAPHLLVNPPSKALPE